ncbi:hypothetical protein [Weissella minor]|uniref:hypothetical protein n=1 Tax=Weissella minor TaxID=1620 RepID=UPI003AF2F3EF
MERYLAKILIVSENLGLDVIENQSKSDCLFNFKNLMTVPYDSSSYYQSIKKNGHFRQLFECTEARPWLLDTIEFKKCIEIFLQFNTVEKITVKTINDDVDYEEVLNDELNEIIAGIHELSMVNFDDNIKLKSIYIKTKAFSLTLTRLGVLQCIYQTRESLIEILKLLNGVLDNE